MEALNFIHAVPEVERHLADELSKKIYEMRVNYSIYRNTDEFFYDILNLDLEWSIPELDEMYSINDRIDNLVIFGAGANGKYTLNLLKKSKYKDVKIIFCDNNPNKWGSTGDDSIDNLPIISPHELFKKYKNSVVIIGSGKNKLEIYSQLLWNYPVQRILCPKRILYGKINEQYFDYFSPHESEVFIDGGSFNGKTSVEFVEWTKRHKERGGV